MTTIDLSFPTCLSSESEPVPIDDTLSHRKRSDTLDSKTLFDTNDLYVEPSSFTSFVGAIDRNTGYDDDMDVDLADLDLNLVLDKGKGKARIDINEQVSDMSFSSPGAGPSTPFSFTLSSFPSSYATYASGSGSPSGSYGYGGDTFSIPLASSPDPTFPLSSLPPLDFTSAPVPSFPSNFHSGFNTEDLVPITSPLEAVKFPFSSNAELWSKETFSPSPIENHEEEPLLSETVPAPAPIPIAQSSASPPPHHSAQQETLLHRTFSAVPTPRHGPAHPQPIRSRSLSSLSVSSTRSISSSLSTLRRKMSKGKLVRRILLKPRSKQAQPPEEEDVVDAAFARSLTGPSLSPIAVVHLPSSPVNVRRGKRSHSVPIIATSSISVDDSTTILPSKEETASWDLPSELTFEIFACLVILHKMDYTRYVTTGALPLTIKKKDEEKIKDLCSGEGLGSAIKELVRLSRISKQISSIILPSALFSNLPLSTISTSNTSSTSLVRLIRDNGGACLRNLEFPTDITSVMAGRMKLISVSSPTSPTYPCLTSISLEGCNSPGLSNGVLNGMLKSHKGLKKVNLRGLSNVDDVTCKDALAVLDKLTNLNLSCCKNVSGRGIRALASSSMKLKYLRIPGIGLASEEDGLEMCKALGRRMMGGLKVLEMAHLEHLTDAAVEALVDVSNNEDDEESRNVIHLRAKDAGHGTSSTDTYTRRITPLKHISLSSCPLLTDSAAHYLAYAVPDLEFLELSGIGEAMVEDGVIALLNTIHGIRKIDLEGTSIGDGVLDCLSASEGKRAQKLEHLVLSGLTSISNTALLTLIQSAPLLRVLEIDSTRTSQTTIKEFIRLTRQRKLEGAECVAIDCRSVGEPFVRELGSKGDVRTRRGWRGWGSTELGYIDKGGVWEYDSSRVIFKCFWSWQAVDTLRLKLLEESGGSGTEGSGRGGRSKLRRGMNEWLRRSGSSGGEEEDGERGCVVM